MKKILIALLIVTTLASCGTILGGPITDCQKTKPKTGHRTLRWAPLIFDSPIGWIIDFSDGAIYKPCNEQGKK